MLCASSGLTRRGLRSFASSVSASSAAQKYDVVVVGGGAAGQAASHQILNSRPDLNVAIVEPSSKHVYQPGQTMVGGGMFQAGEIVRSMESVMPAKATWLKYGATAIDHEANTVSLAGGETVEYDQLIVVPGIKTLWDATPGLKAGLADEDSGVTSNYSLTHCQKTFRLASEISKSAHSKAGTRAVFTQCPMPIKCAGAPQKAMYLSESLWRKAGARKNIEVDFISALPAIFGAPYYAAPLAAHARSRGIHTTFNMDLAEIRVADKVAVFKSVVDGDETTLEQSYDMLHVTPRQGAMPFMKGSAIADAGGFVAVDDGTMQSTVAPNVWSCGDASSIPTSKTAAAVSAQVPVMLENMFAVMDGKQPTATYSGYTSCPIPVSHDKLLLAEFAYGGEPAETFGAFGVDQRVPRAAFLHLKSAMKELYWHGMLTGRWKGVKSLPFVK